MFLRLLTGGALGVALMVTGSQAATIAFHNIEGGDTSGDGLVAMFSLDVTEASASTVLIKVMSAANAGARYFISGVYVDDDPGAVLTGEPMAFSAANSVGVVNLAYNGNPANLPQGNLVGFSQTAKYLRVPGNANGNAIQQGESAGFIFGGVYADVLAALQNGTTRFGIHVQGLGAGLSDAYVTEADPVMPPTVPLPAPALLLLGGLGGLAALRRKS